MEEDLAVIEEDDIKKPCSKCYVLNDLTDFLCTACGEELSEDDEVGEASTPCLAEPLAPLVPSQGSLATFPACEPPAPPLVLLVPPGPSARPWL